jgi:hypothetical protein
MNKIYFARKLVKIKTKEEQTFLEFAGKLKQKIIYLVRQK